MMTEDEPTLFSILGEIQSVRLEKDKIVVVTLMEPGIATAILDADLGAGYDDDTVKVPVEFTFSAEGSEIVFHGRRTGQYEGQHVVPESWTFPDAPTIGDGQ